MPQWTKNVTYPSPPAKREYECPHGFPIKHAVQCKHCCKKRAEDIEEAAIEKIKPLKLWLAGFYESAEKEKHGDTPLPAIIKKYEEDLEKLKAEADKGWKVYDEYFGKEKTPESGQS